MSDLSAMARARYRVAQFFGGLCATVDEAEIVHAAQLLPPGALTLFLLLPVDAQRHSLNVLHSLESQGTTPNDLAVAALLHDSGKLAAAGQISLWTRGPLVLLESFAPTLATRMARSEPPRGWRYALWVQQHHAAIGAVWTHQLGCSEIACQLIAHHQDQLSALHRDESRITSLLRRLQHADNQN